MTIPTSAQSLAWSEARIRNDDAKAAAEKAELTALRQRVTRLETALQYAHEAMCQATFNMNGKNCRELNWAIDKAREALEGK